MRPKHHPGIIIVLLLAAFALGTARADSPMRAKFDESTGAVRIAQGGRPVLTYQYHAAAVPEGFLDGVHENSRIYARARSNYIHPLFGPEGKELTRDWSPDHPHHRGIYWAWPEVRFGVETGDLHALQHVWAQPTGKLETRQEDDWAEVEAENRWMWEDKRPIVRETAKIRAWKAGKNGRDIDLEFRFEALEAGVTLARRGADKYGGLNIRLAPIEDLQLFHHADPADGEPRMAWQGAAGRWAGADQALSMTVFEMATNPDYPGDYVEYPKLPWFQPAFPRSGTRFALEKGKPLHLRYRIWIRTGPPPAEEELRAKWLTYNENVETISASRE